MNSTEQISNDRQSAPKPLPVICGVLLACLAIVLGVLQHLHIHSLTMEEALSYQLQEHAFRYPWEPEKTVHINHNSSASDSTLSTKRIITQPGSQGSKDEIICWGDSLTYGTGAYAAYIVNEFEGPSEYDAGYKTYPEFLSFLTGLTTLNFGVPGATSDEIVAMQKGEYSNWISSWLEENNDALKELVPLHKGTVLVLEIGSNGGWETYDELIEQYQAMIDYAGCDRYIIVGDTDNPGESPADPLQEPFPWYEDNASTTWEDALEEAFGEHFINMRLYLIENGIADAGLSTAGKDLYDEASGIIPLQLRTDWTHLNSYGYYSQAIGIYKKGVELGYWS